MFMLFNRLVGSLKPTIIFIWPKQKEMEQCKTTLEIPGES